MCCFRCPFETNCYNCFLNLICSDSLVYCSSLPPSDVILSVNYYDGVGVCWSCLAIIFR